MKQNKIKLNRKQHDKLMLSKNILDACKGNICNNGGVCRDSIDNSYECICPPMFTGTNRQSN